MKTLFDEYRVRILWLSIGLAASLIIANSVNSFEELLSDHILLVGFIPMVVYLSDAVGTQMESITIREISKSEHLGIRVFIKKQLILTILVGITLSIVSFLTVLLFWRQADVALVISLGLLVSIMIALVTGSVIPFIFWKFHQDPAEASGPIATVIQDFLSIVSLLIIASVIL